MVNFSFSICYTQKTVTLPSSSVGLFYYFYFNLSENVTERFAEGKGSKAHYVLNCPLKPHRKESTVAPARVQTLPAEQLRAEKDTEFFSL